MHQDRSVCALACSCGEERGKEGKGGREKEIEKEREKKKKKKRETKHSETHEDAGAIHRKDRSQQCHR